MTKQRQLTLGLFVGALILVHGQSAKGAVYINTDMPIEAVSFDPCTNEDVALAGIAHLVGTLTLNNNLFNLTAHVNYNIDGVGLTSGDTYESNANGLAGQNVELDNTSLGEATITLRATIIGPGSLPNASADVVGHLTVTPDGTLTAVVDQVRMSCH
jgi:hypothetical protein